MAELYFKIFAAIFFLVVKISTFIRNILLLVGLFFPGSNISELPC